MTILGTLLKNKHAGEAQLTWNKLPEEDVLRFTSGLEDSNFSPDEMLHVLVERAANPTDARPAITLTLPLDDVLAAHEERRKRTHDEPGLAGTLLKLAQDPPVRWARHNLQT